MFNIAYSIHKLFPLGFHPNGRGTVVDLGLLPSVNDFVQYVVGYWEASDRQFIQNTGRGAQIEEMGCLLPVPGCSSFEHFVCKETNITITERSYISHSQRTTKPC